MFKERIVEVKEDLKNHIKRNQNKYYVCGLVGVAGVTFVVTRRITIIRYMPIIGAKPIRFIDRFTGVQMYKPKNTQIYNIYGYGRHHGLGHIVKCKETNAIYRSQKQAAKVMGLSEGRLGTHLNYPQVQPHVNGYHFERLGISA